MPRYVVLRHEVPEGIVNAQAIRGSHYDLMLETDLNLLTWSISDWPLSRDKTNPAERLASHRKEYLHYEGPISNNRGTVARIAAGDYQILDEHESSLEIELTSESSSIRIRITDSMITVLN